MTDYDAIRRDVAEYLNNHGVTVAVDYVPPDRRDSADVFRWKNQRFLMWRLTFSRGTARATFDYRAAEGHCPAYNLPVAVGGNRGSIYRSELIAAEIATGRTWRQLDGNHGKASGAAILPDVAAVVKCLLDDAAAYGETFENWAADYGYDPDSRSAEKLYQECLEAARKLGRVFSPTEQDELRTMLEQF